MYARGAVICVHHMSIRMGSYVICFLCCVSERMNALVVVLEGRGVCVIKLYSQSGRIVCVGLSR